MSSTLAAGAARARRRLCGPGGGGRRGTGIEAVSDAEARLVEAKGSAVSHGQMAGCTPRVIPPAFTTYPKQAREPPLWPPFAVGAMAALRTPNFDYAARPGDALRIAVALVPVSDTPGGGCPGGLGVATTVAGRRHLRRSFAAAGPPAGWTAGPTARSRSRGFPAC